VGTVVDKDGTFALNVDGNPEIVISFVGYQAILIKASKIGNKPLKLEVEAVNLDLESVSMEAKKEPYHDQPDGKAGEEIFYVVEDMPKFPGGTTALKTYIYTNLEYPAEAKKQGIEGEAIVRYLITEKGNPTDVEVLSSTYKGFDEPAMKVIREMPDWSPGMQRGKAVKVWYVIPIKFEAKKE